MANGRLPFSISDPRSKCGTHFGASSLLVTKVANGEKENNEHSLCTDPSILPSGKIERRGRGVWTQATMSTDLKKHNIYKHNELYKN